MQAVLNYFEALATQSKVFANSPTHRTYAASVGEFDNLSKSVLKTTELCLCADVDMSDWINRNEAETEMLPVFIYVTKKCKPSDFEAQYVAKSEARSALIHLYSKIVKDKREQNSITKMFDLSSKVFDYLNGEKGDLYGAMLTITCKIPINYQYNPADWN